jgi:hypothetical protein
MKLPDLFLLTNREQRAVIVIVLALLTATLVKSYRDGRFSPAPEMLVPAEIDPGLSAESQDDEETESSE